MYSRGMFAEPWLEAPRDGFFHGPRLDDQSSTIGGQQTVKPFVAPGLQRSFAILREEVGKLFLSAVGQSAVARREQIGIRK